MGRAFLSGGKVGIKAPSIVDEYTLLLIHGNGFVDNSKYSHAITNNGAAIAASPTKFGKGSLYFNGSSYLTMPGGNFDFGTGDFTVDCWVYPETVTIDNFFFAGAYSKSGDFFFGRQTNQKIGIGRTAVAWDTAIQYSLPVGVWSHVAVSRKNGTVYFFVNGKLIGSAANSQSYSISKGLAYVGAQELPYCYKGYMEELRVSNIARWTSAFTPPTAPY